MPDREYRICALWIEGALSYLEQLCLKSFVDVGYEVILYAYGEVTGVPDGVQIGNANDILPKVDTLKHARTGSPALHSDLFRYRLLERRDHTIWVDTDAYCVKRFEPRDGFFFGWESENHLNGGVLALPQESKTLKKLIEFTSDEYAIPYWYPSDYVSELEALKAAGTPVHAGEQRWGVWGPHALTNFLQETDEVRYALPVAGLYPVSFSARHLLLRPGCDLSHLITSETYSIHFYGRRVRRRLIRKFGGIPRPKSLLGQLLKKHGVDPTQAPLSDNWRPAGTADAA